MNGDGMADHQAPTDMSGHRAEQADDRIAVPQIGSGDNIGLAIAALILDAADDVEEMVIQRENRLAVLLQSFAHPLHCHPAQLAAQTGAGEIDGLHATDRHAGQAGGRVLYAEVSALFAFGAMRRGRQRGFSGDRAVKNNGVGLRHVGSPNEYHHPQARGD